MCAAPLALADVSGGVPALLRGLVVAPFIEGLGQVGSVDLPELLIVVQGCIEVPVFP